MSGWLRILALLLLLPGTLLPGGVQVRLCACAGLMQALANGGICRCAVGASACEHEGARDRAAVAACRGELTAVLSCCHVACAEMACCDVVPAAPSCCEAVATAPSCCEVVATAPSRCAVGAAEACAATAIDAIAPAVDATVSTAATAIAATAGTAATAATAATVGAGVAASSRSDACGEHAGPALGKPGEGRCQRLELTIAERAAIAASAHVDVLVPPALPPCPRQPDCPPSCVRAADAVRELPVPPPRWQREAIPLLI